MSFAFHLATRRRQRTSTVRRRCNVILQLTIRASGFWGEEPAQELTTRHLDPLIPRLFRGERCLATRIAPLRYLLRLDGGFNADPALVTENFWAHEL